MNGDHPSPEQLQRHADGALTRPELAELQTHVLSCGDCTAQIAALSRLHELVAMEVHERADAIDLSQMFANIERGIAQPGTKAAPAGGLLRRLRHISTAGPAVGALALAAAVLLMVYRPDGSSPTTGTDDSYEVTAATRSEVVEVDFGANAGTVFDISLSDGSSNPVVWIDDGDDDDDDENQE